MNSALPAMPTRLLIHIEGKTGYLDEHGELIIPPRFKHAYPFDLSTGLAAACEKPDLWGFIDAQGDWAIEPLFHEIENFDPNTGLAIARLVNFDNSSLPVGKIAGFIDQSGHWAIAPHFKDLKPFDANTGLAPAADKKEGSWGLIDRQGAWAVPRFYFDIDLFPGSSGLFWAQDTLERKVEVTKGRRRTFAIAGNWGVIDQNGNWVLNPQFIDVREKSCETGLAWGTLKELLGQEAGVDQEGRLIVFDPPVCQAGTFNVETGLAVAQTGDFIKGKWGWISKKGAWALPPRFRFLGDLDPDCGLALAGLESREMLGWIDERGEWVVRAEFEQLGLPSPMDGLAWAKKDGMWGVIDRGACMIKTFPELSEVRISDDDPTSHELVAFTGNGDDKRCGRFDRMSGWVVPPDYHRVGDVDREKGIFWVECASEEKKDEREIFQYRLIDRSGRELSEVETDADFLSYTLETKIEGNMLVLKAQFRNPTADSYKLRAFYLNRETGEVIARTSSDTGSFAGMVR